MPREMPMGVKNDHMGQLLRHIGEMMLVFPWI